MTRLELVFGRKAHKELADEPELDGRLIGDGETDVIRGVEWLPRRDDAGDKVRRFICTLVTAPADS